MGGMNNFFLKNYDEKLEKIKHNNQLKIINAEKKALIAEKKALAAEKKALAVEKALSVENSSNLLQKKYINDIITFDNNDLNFILNTGDETVLSTDKDVYNKTDTIKISFEISEKDKSLYNRIYLV